jgi:hypothetical protein
MQSDSLAFDRASVRSFDSDGHLHVDTANISKATVNAYYGREIPDWKNSGLEADRLYNLFRDPAELEKAASTFAGKPILITHTSISADEHPHDKVIGAIGTDVQFKAPFLTAPLTIWDGDAIALIESGKQRALSCGYRYTPVFEPGVFDGEPYDARMTNIEANHLALVISGRAGPDVIVGDSKPKEAHTPPLMEQFNMKSIVLTRKASLVHGAVLGHIRPLLASDSLPDLSPAFAGVTSANFAASKPRIVGRIAEQLAGKLAADKNLDDLPKFLSAFDAMDPAEEKDMPKDKKAKDAEEDDTEEEKEAKAKKKAAEEEAEAKKEAAEKEKEAKKEASDEDDDEDDKKKKKAQDGVTRSAMDSAIKGAVDAAVTRERERSQSLAHAKETVEAGLGRVKACDSAEGYYRTALKAMDVKNVDALAESALRPMVEALLDARKSFSKPRLVAPAMDTAAAKEHADRFPNASRLKR